MVQGPGRCAVGGIVLLRTAVLEGGRGAARCSGDRMVAHVHVDVPYQLCVRWGNSTISPSVYGTVTCKVSGGQGGVRFILNPMAVHMWPCSRDRKL